MEIKAQYESNHLVIIDHVPVSAPTIRPSHVDLRSVIKYI